jgi:hypothetical protein
MIEVPADSEIRANSEISASMLERRSLVFVLKKKSRTRNGGTFNCVNSSFVSE